MDRNLHALTEYVNGGLQEELVRIDIVNWAIYQPFDCARAGERHGHGQSVIKAGGLSFRKSLQPEIGVGA